MSDVVFWIEVPYALPPERFSDPEALPADYRYLDVEFIYESRCELPPQTYCIQKRYRIQMGFNRIMMDKLAVYRLLTKGSNLGFIFFTRYFTSG